MKYVMCAIVLLAATPMGATVGKYGVGVIAAARNSCAPGYDYVEIHTDDENRKNSSSTSGWTGAIRQESGGTTFGFCRVNGLAFAGVRGPSFAVLRLASECPPNFRKATRIIDTEDRRPRNWSRGNVQPTIVSNDVHMKLCVFPGAQPSVDEILADGEWPPHRYRDTFPKLYMSYGVFAAPSDVWLQSGYVFTDDQDPSRWNALDFHSHSSGYSSSGIVYDSGDRRYNTFYRTAQVRNDQCPSKCPVIGSWDTANCYVGSAPAGTRAFIYDFNFYYTPASGSNRCPLPGSGFDSLNCHVMRIPPNVVPFVYDNNWYVAGACK